MNDPSKDVRNSEPRKSEPRKSEYEPRKSESYMPRKSATADMNFPRTCSNCEPTFQTYGGSHVSHWSPGSESILGNSIQFCEALFHVCRCPEFDITVLTRFFIFCLFFSLEIYKFFLLGSLFDSWNYSRQLSYAMFVDGGEFWNICCPVYQLSETSC